MKKLTILFLFIAFISKAQVTPIPQPAGKYVPYTGAISNVNLGTNSLSVGPISITTPSTTTGLYIEGDVTGNQYGFIFNGNSGAAADIINQAIGNARFVVKNNTGGQRWVMGNNTSTVTSQLNNFYISNSTNPASASITFDMNGHTKVQGRLGVGAAHTATPASILDLAAGNATLPAIGLASQTTYTGATSGSLWRDAIADLNLKGSMKISSNATVTGTVYLPHIIGNTSAVTVATLSGVGTNGTASVTTNSTDLSGIVTITTGTASVGSNAGIAVVTFATAYTVAPNVSLDPYQQNSNALSGNTQMYISNVSTTAFTITTGAGTAPTTSTAYKYVYQVFQ